ncbi:DPP IV N-terminal domain-containing protein, partial [Paenarthrobacter aurescens]|nr:DPP IV N-terminal domain-containing protein [Paenarthrobacter aurescens]
FSPDGSKLAFALSKTGSLNLYVMDLASGQTRQVTDGRYNSTEPTWFPDSQTLAYTSDQAGAPQIYKVNVNGGTPQRIT